MSAAPKQELLAFDDVTRKRVQLALAYQNSANSIDRFREKRYGADIQICSTNQLFLFWKCSANVVSAGFDDG